MQKIIDKAAVLIEALPFIKAFHGKKIVIKFGGSIMDSENAMKSVLQDIVFMKYVGWLPVVIHGGGKAISEAMNNRGVKPLFVNGLRVTDRKTMEIVENVLAHKINAQIVNLMNMMDGEAVGVSGLDNGLIRVDKMFTENNGQSVDFGFVGQVRYINANFLNRLIESGKIPVIAPLGLGDDGESYNINADLVAGEIAASIGARKLVYLTDTPGILRTPSDEKSIISTINRQEAEKLIAAGIIEGGMIPKVNSCLDALRFGVNKGHIIDGRIKHSLLLEIFTKEGIGTEILKDGSERIR